MCRISGMVNLRADTEKIEEVVQGMCELQKHGGPDDKGLYISSQDKLVLGNCRLALLDLSYDGHMPMKYQDRYFITYNGEIYNYSELKEELLSFGHVFQNHTDTEVILAVFSQWKTQGFCKLKGMFAFALWDNSEKELYLVRDGAGIKPLYYAVTDKYIVFASEVRAFKRISELQEQNNNWPIYLMAYGHLPEPVTTLALIKPITKGCFLKYELKTNSYNIQSYSHYSYTCQLDKVDTSQIIREALERSVKRHLLADAPVGIFLSGGLDSGIIAALASGSRHRAIKTLSIYFEDPAYSEKKYQDILINKLNCDHHQFLLKEEEFHQSFPDILDSMDMPSCDGVNTWFISKYAAIQGLKAVLSGVGGDELFGGYPSFNRFQTASLLQHFPRFILKTGKRSNAKRLTRMAYLDIKGIKGIYLFLRGHFSPYEIARQLGAYENEVWSVLKATPELTSIENLDFKNQASWMEFNLYMQNQLLRDSDVMSMIHGVEIRVPFLDEDTVRLALKLDPSIKFEGPRSKQILIDIFKDILPQEIWNRRKMGFSFPFAKWLASSEYVKALMETSNKNSRLGYTKFLNGKLHWSHMMSLIILNNRKLAMA